MPRITLALANTAYNLADLLSVADAPTAALAGAGAGNVDNGAHKYAITFTDGIGESAIGVLSAAVTVADKTADGKVALTGIPLGPAGTTARKVYRTAAAGSVYKLQSTIANNTATTLTDNVADSSLGATAPATASRWDTKPPFFSDLSVLADAANSGDVLLDVANPNITVTNYGPTLGASDAYRLQGPSPVAPGDVWLYTATAGQVLHITGRPY